MPIAFSSGMRATLALALAGPPVAPALHVFARIVAQVRRTDDEDLEAVRARLVAPPHAGRDAHGVPLLELDDLAVDFHPPAPPDDNVDLLLRQVCVAVRKAVAGRDALIAQGRVLQRERLRRSAELQVGRAVELRTEVLEIPLDVRERERHGRYVDAAASQRQFRIAAGGLEPPTFGL